MSPEKVVVQDGVYSWDCEADYAFKLYEYRRNLRMGIWMFFMLPPLIWLHVELHVLPSPFLRFWLPVRLDI